MAKPKALVLTGRGLNTDLEMKYAFERAGAEAERILTGDVLSGDADILNYQIFVIPGGFLDGDDIASARVFATQLRRIEDKLRKFIEGDRLVLGICNGFQALVKSGLLPYADFEQLVTLTYNASGKFEDRWVYLAVNERSPCVFTQGTTYLPVRHGEGMFYAPDDILDRLERENLVVARYVGRNGESSPPYPENPNGAMRAVAGICDPSGRVYGMMPHPEAYVHPFLHPRWTRMKAEGSLPREGDGMKIFRNAVEYFR
ncbi:MAG: phosphoribosylformylglycinamidine synthase subunit PurQ [Candidatus Aenigmarchaeota archaeon]|nr:phosphoribosylformylglycinamidine synthase subunit PurQ [Candidatus Aenigmarchaeota archaeon]